MNLALVQLAPDLDAGRTRERVAEQVAKGIDAGAALVVAPEGSSGPLPTTRAEAAQVAEPIDGPFVSLLCSLSTSSCTVMAGMVEDLGDGAFANTVVAARGGEVVATYRKLHLFAAFGADEAAWSVPGGSLTVLEVGGWRVGVMTCFDLRFPELTVALAAEGVDLLVVPAAWYAGVSKARQLETLLGARALDAVSYLGFAGQPAPLCCGGTGLFGPLGERLSSLPDAAEGVLVAELDRTRLDEARGLLPLAPLRRFAVELIE